MQCVLNNFDILLSKNGNAAGANNGTVSRTVDCEDCG
jgi:hypothetical protein